jgi:hypothetical protein
VSIYRGDGAASSSALPECETADLSTALRSGRDDKFVAGKLTDFPVEVRGTADPSAALLTNKRRVWCRIAGARPPAYGRSPSGWADFWCRPSGPGLQTPLSHVHSSLNLTQASRLLGMTKERVTLLWKDDCRPEGVFHRLGSSNHFSWKLNPFLCHPERSRGICSSADLYWKISQLPCNKFVISTGA